ncbi:histidinol-phosphate aminotransferase, partial [Mesorhizobium sp. M7D.F.Ca.US.004.03.1.1]
MSKASDMVRTEVNRLSPYNSGLTIDEVQQRYAPARIAKLGSNENPLGPSPSLATTMHAGSEMFRLYPDPAGRKLRQAIADKYAVTEDQIILGNGSEDLLSVISRAVLRLGDAVVTLYPSFSLHEDYATLM